MEVQLKNKEAFRSVLSSYAMSEHAKKVLAEVEYVGLIGPAAAGRNTIITELVKTGEFKQVVSDTTRPPKFRDGKLEEEGVVYYFRDEESMLKDLEAGEFLEAELIHDQQVSGTSIRELEELSKAGKIGINDFEFGGAINILKAKPDSKIIAILPPSYDIWIDRFQKREVISHQELVNRISTAQKVIQLIRSEPRVRVVINHDVAEATKEIYEYAQGIPQSQEQRSDVGMVLDDFERNISSFLAEEK
jgi:guanylate kinase